MRQQKQQQKLWQNERKKTEKNLNFGILCELILEDFIQRAAIIPSFNRLIIITIKHKWPILRVWVSYNGKYCAVVISYDDFYFMRAKKMEINNINESKNFAINLFFEPCHNCNGGGMDFANWKSQYICFNETENKVCFFSIF